jgi:hypothetical protein
MDEIEKNVTNSRERIADISVTVWENLNKQGFDISLLQVMRDLNISSSEGLGLSLEEIAAAYMVLTENIEAEAVEEATEEVVEEPVEGEEDQNTAITSPEETDSATLGEKNAAKSALDYLAYTAFSYSGLVEQLKYEGFTHEEAVYGVDRCGADWNEQAAKMAQDYLDYSSFSRTELIAQLEYEGFTRQQAEYGAQAVGY